LSAKQDWGRTEQLRLQWRRLSNSTKHTRRLCF